MLIFSVVIAILNISAVLVWCFRKKNYVPLRDAILKLDENENILGGQYNIVDAFGLSDDTYISNYYIDNYLKNHLVGNKITRGGHSLKKSRILNEELPFPDGSRGKTSRTTSGNKWDENYSCLHLPSGKALYTDVSVEKESFEKILENQKKNL